MSTHLVETEDGYLEGDGLTDKNPGSWKGHKDLTDIQRFYSGASVLVTGATGLLYVLSCVGARFYSGASVLVTGATGFMGKVLIEKLLRSCPDIETIYMMVREKKRRSLDERIDDLVSSPCFDRIKKERPGFETKLKAVAGDIGLKGLGISEEDRHLLQQQVDIVFHVAATVRFDEHLKLAILQNVRGTREVLELCKTFRKLKAVVHVSTAYSNCPNTQIVERFYEPPIPSDYAIHIAETTDIDTMDHLSHKLLGKWPNTYTFTKALSEDIIRRTGQSLPIAVIRPSIVLTTANEPSKGFIDNMYGPAGFMVGMAYGILRTMRLNLTCQANVVPCDMVVSSIIATARDVAVNRTAPQEVPVYNYVSTKANPISWRGYMSLQKEVGFKFPPSKVIWFFVVVIINNEVIDNLMRLLLHILPAILVDTYLLVTNKEPKMLKIYPKIHKFLDLMVFFTTREWDFKETNVRRMWGEMTDEDRKMFSFDMDSLNWREFFFQTWPGMRLHLLKDPIETIPAAKARWHKLKVLHYISMLFLSTAAICLASNLLPILWTALLVVTDTVADYCCRMCSNLISSAINYQLPTIYYLPWD